jgi:hypothetical protein
LEERIDSFDVTFILVMDVSASEARWELPALLVKCKDGDLAVLGDGWGDCGDDAESVTALPAAGIVLSRATWVTGAAFELRGQVPPYQV